MLCLTVLFGSQFATGGREILSKSNKTVSISTSRVGLINVSDSILGGGSVKLQSLVLPSHSGAVSTVSMAEKVVGFYPSLSTPFAPEFGVTAS